LRLTALWTSPVYRRGYSARQAIHQDDQTVIEVVGYARAHSGGARPYLSQTLQLYSAIVRTRRVREELQLHTICSYRRVSPLQKMLSRIDRSAQLRGYRCRSGLCQPTNRLKPVIRSDRKNPRPSPDSQV